MCEFNAPHSWLNSELAVSGAINRQKVALSRAINSHFLTFYGAINSQKGRQILYPNPNTNERTDVQTLWYIEARHCLKIAQIFFVSSF